MRKKRDVSSVGLERLLDRQEVTGSNPVRPTKSLVELIVVMYYVYALYSEKYDKIYIGYTSDLEQRLLSHNHEKNRGYTGRYRPWRLLYSEAIDGKSAALVRERQLKSYRGREYLRSLIP